MCHHDPRERNFKSFCLALVIFSTKYSSTASVLPARAPETVPLPWQLSTRTRLTAAPRATPESDPLTIPATCVPWLSHWLACSGTRIENVIELQLQIHKCCRIEMFHLCVHVFNLSVNSDSILFRGVIEVCDEYPSLNLSVRTLHTAIHQIHLRPPSIICRGQMVNLTCN